MAIRLKPSKFFFPKAVSKGCRKTQSYDERDDEPTVELLVTMVRRSTYHAFQVVLAPNEEFDHMVIVWLPKSLVWGQDLAEGQSNRTVRMPLWLWRRHCVELRERR